jgi:signal transduction histidine kinase
VGDYVEVIVTDEGQGIMNPTNLFVPFFTTKPEGSGIGLTLSRQIAEAHDGTVSLTNRDDRTGAEAVLRLPR